MGLGMGRVAGVLDLMRPRPVNAATMGRLRAAIWGAVAQLGERLVRNEEVSGSIPLGSTSLRKRSAAKAAAA